MDPNFNEKLIEEVRKHDCLYNLGSPDYRNTIKKDKIWTDIGGTMQSTDEVCKKRWKTLRDSYKRNKRSEELTTGSAAPVPNKKWKYAETMSFLNTVKDYRPTVGTQMEDKEENFVVEYLLDESSCESAVLDNVLDNVNSFEGSGSSSSSTPFKAKAKKKSHDADIKMAFATMMEKCCGKINEIACAGPPETKTPTIQLFESLANKITSAALTEDDVDAIEARVVAVVHQEIANRRQKRQ